MNNLGGIMSRQYTCTLFLNYIIIITFNNDNKIYLYSLFPKGGKYHADMMCLENIALGKFSDYSW